MNPCKAECYRQVFFHAGALGLVNITAVYKYLCLSQPLPFGPFPTGAPGALLHIVILLYSFLHRQSQVLFRQVFFLLPHRWSLLVKSVGSEGEGRKNVGLSTEDRQVSLWTLRPDSGFSIALELVLLHKLLWGGLQSHHIVLFSGCIGQSFGCKWEVLSLQ